jgi:hypothetical protein
MSRSSPGTVAVAVAVAVLGLAAVAGCNNAGENVCEDIGNCSQGGDSVWISSCQAEAKLLASEASNVGCGHDYDAYSTCAEDSYVCRGATALFPGCDDRLAALDACLAAATAGTSCVALASATAACGGAGVDGGAGPDAGLPPGPDAGLPPACTAARNCLAACYLGAVANVCAPDVAELQAANACGATCPP